VNPNPYLFIVIFIGVALAFPLVPLALAWVWRRFFQPPKPGAEKNAIYEWRSAHTVPVTVLSLRHHLFDFRRRGGFSRAICRRIYRAAGRRIYCDSDFSISSG
jgi:hypothetical protein